MRVRLATAAVLVAALVFAAPAFADDGGVMQRLMGHQGYAAMAEHMRGVLGEQRTNEMLAECDTAMASHARHGAEPGAQHTGGMMRMHGMHGGS